MTLITIVSKYGMLAVYHKRLPGSRLLWTGKRQGEREASFEVWATGELPGALYEQAAQLAMHHGEELGIPPSMIHRAGGTPYRLSRTSDTKTKRMF
jgi:hypothetical protein